MGDYNNIQSNSTYSKTKIKDDIIITNENYFQKLNLKLTDKDRSLSIMHLLPKLHKTPKHQLFCTKNCSTKPVSGVICKIFKMLFKHAENFHNKSTFYSSYKKF